MAIPVNGVFLPPSAEVLAAEPNSCASSEAITKAGRVLSLHHDNLMALPGVVMVGESLNAIGQPAILVGVKTRGDLAGLPKAIDGVPVMAEVIGEVDAY